MKFGKLGILVASLAVRYTITGAPPNYKSTMQRYNVPKEISIVEATYEPRKKQVFASESKEKMNIK